MKHPHSSVIRSFFGISLHEGSQINHAKIIRALHDSPGGKDIHWVSPSNLHITLGFLGNIDETSLTTVACAVALKLNQIKIFEVELKQISPFPTVIRPRFVVREVVKSKPLQTISRLIKKELAAHHIEDKQSRFLPHLTLGHLKQRKWPFRNRLPQLKEETLMVQKVTLFRSLHTEEGSQYHPIVEIPLQSSP